MLTKIKKIKDNFPIRNQCSSKTRLNLEQPVQLKYAYDMAEASPNLRQNPTLLDFVTRMQLQNGSSSLHAGHSWGASAAWAGQKCSCGACGSSWHTQLRAGHAIWLPVLLYIPAVTLPQPCKGLWKLLWKHRSFRKIMHGFSSTSYEFRFLVLKSRLTSRDKKHLFIIKPSKKLKLATLPEKFHWWRTQGSELQDQLMFQAKFAGSAINALI